jgi:hypothetical protein
MILFCLQDMDMTTTEVDMIRTELTVTTVTADMVKIDF